MLLKSRYSSFLGSGLTGASRTPGWRGGAMLADENALPEYIDHVNSWVLTELTGLNRDILARRRPAGELAAELTRSVLTGLPPPESLPLRRARQLVVLLGLAGASVGRHYQEQDPARR